MKVSSLLLVLLLSHCALAQDLLTEITLPGKVENINGMMIENDIFLSMIVTTPTKRLLTSYLVAADGSQKGINLTSITGKYLIGGVRNDQQIYFYYLNEINDQILIEALVWDNVSGKATALTNSMEVPGKIYGSFVEDGSLFMLCGIKKEYTLRLLQFQNGNLVKQTNFPLSIDLARKKEGIVSFFDTTYPTTPKQAAAVTKFVKDKRTIWVTFDEPYREYDQSVTDATIFRTTAIKLDRVTAKIEIKSFYESQKHPFTSAMLNGDLYRLVMEPRSMRIDQFNFATGKLVKSVPLARGEERGRDSTYAHIGGRYKTEKDVKGAAIVKRVFGYLLIVDSLSANEKQLTVGHYGDHMLYLIVPGVAGLIVTAASLIVGEVAEGPISTVYSYYRGSINDGFTATYRSPFVRKVIDDYEYNQLIKKVRYDYRGYLNAPGLTYAIYQKNNSKTIQIHKFRQPGLRD